METITKEQLEDLGTKIEALKNSISNIQMLYADLLKCESDVSKSLLYSAIKKYSTPISEFKI